MEGKIIKTIATNAMFVVLCLAAIPICLIEALYYRGKEFKDVNVNDRKRYKGLERIR